MKRLILLGLSLAFAALFTALGVWQVERLSWKTALIKTIENRLAEPPRAITAESAWSPNMAYTRVSLRGTFLHDRETLVQAVTERGPGFWVMTPLQTDTGFVLINRGFAPSEQRKLGSARWSLPAGEATVTGLMRASEPHGGFLRANAPADGRWYSRDVPAIAEARNLAAPVAPFFVDSDSTPNVGGYPIGGLTVLRFHNSHLVYAVTWFGLAGLALAGAWLAGSSRLRARCV